MFLIFLAVCSLPCLNGGTCVSPNVCACGKGWSGEHCHIPVCSPQCVHGSCTAPETCTCKIGWQGKQCSVPVCTRSCQNGGTCIAPGVCSCPHTFSGGSCHIAMCTDLPSLQGRQWSCEVANNSRSCNLTCSNGYDFVFPTHTHTFSCNHDGRWDHNITELWSQLPICSKVEPLELITVLQLELEFESVCEDLSPNKTNQLLTTAASNLKEATCAGVNCTTADVQANIEKCITSSQVDDSPDKRAPSETLSRLEVTFTLRVKPGYATMIKQTAECQEANTMLQTKAHLIVIIILGILDDDFVSFPDISYVPGSVSFSGTKLRCPQPWQGLVCTSCVTCPPGSYKHQTCQKCPKGTYQARANQTSCIPCSFGKTTLQKGSFHSSHCFHDGPTYSGVCNYTQPIASYMTAMPTLPLPHVCQPQNHGILSEPWRKASEPSDPNNIRDDNTRKGGNFQSGWYRLSNAIGGRMPECCPPTNRCGTAATGWLNGDHPSTVGEEVERKVCFHFSDCCEEPSATVKVVNCGSYFVYHLPDSRWHPGGYCGDA